jgi:hypothetical protein
MQKITKCRISGDENLISVLSLGKQDLTGIFPKSVTEKISNGPLELVWSPKSQLLQLGCSFELGEMYGENYGYRSGLNQSMVNHLTDKIRHLEAKYGVSAGDSVIDIGSNDATSLRAYRTTGIKRIGVDPTGRKFEKFYTDGIKLIPDFFPTPELPAAIGSSKVKVVTSISMFYDLEDPIAFARSVASILDRNGVWHLEQSYMPSMIRMNSYDTICHEHLEYYSLHSIKYVMDRAGLKILDVQMNGVNGGSFALTVTHQDSSMRPNQAVINWLFEQELKMNFDTPGPFREFEARVFAHRKALRSLIEALNGDGRKVFGYGASTKGNVTLQFCRFTSKEIPFMAEINPDKFGALTPGTHIPIISDAEATAMKPDYYLVLPWHFKDGIIRREQAYLAAGGKLIFPFPEIEIVGG